MGRKKGRDEKGQESERKGRGVKENRKKREKGKRRERKKGKNDEEKDWEE